MITYSIIQKSQLEGATRLDAEYYQPKYLKVKESLESVPHTRLEDLSIFVRCGPFGSNLLCETYTADGITVIRPFNLNNLTANSGDLVSIPKSEVINQNLHLYKNGDVFFSRVGDVRFGIAEGFSNELTISPNIIAMRVKNALLDPYFLVAFLSSRYGFLQVARGLKVVAQPTIQTDDVRNVLIPTFSREQQEVVGNCVRESFKERNRSKTLYSQAENLLLEELGLAGEEFEDELTYVIDYSDAEEAERIDAEYFQPKYDKLISKIKKKSKVYQLQKTAAVKRGSLIDPKFYDEAKGTPYIRGKDFSTGSLEKSSLVYISQDFKPRRETKVKTGDSVFASIGSVGTLALVTEEFDNSFISNNTGTISLKNKKEVLPEYLTILLQSIIGKLQFEKESSQTAQPKISDTQVKNFKIPILPKPTQQKISKLVKQSFDLCKESKALIEKAKREVEEIIEKRN